MPGFSCSHGSPERGLCPAQTGFVLLAVLWVTALLAMFALNYSTAARLKGLAVQVSRDLSQDRLLLLSALELGRHEYLKYHANKALLQDKDFMEWITGRPLELMYPRHEPYNVTVEGGQALVAVVGGAGRLNINRVSQALLERILEVCGVEPGVQTTSLVNSILDWIDQDDLRRPEGAESDYYMELERPYLSKNGELQSLEELLLIRGVTLELYQGTQEVPGLVDFFAVTGQNTVIDVNSASPRSFALIEDFPEESVQEIIALRQERPVANLADLADVVPQRYMSQFSEFFGVVESFEVIIRAALVHDEEGQLRWMETTVNLAEGGS